MLSSLILDHVIVRDVDYKNHAVCLAASSFWMIASLVLLQVCLAAVGLVGDLCRALQSNILPFCDEVMQLLLENLGVSILQPT